MEISIEGTVNIAGLSVYLLILLATIQEKLDYANIVMRNWVRKQ
jgi:hypothetical protein